jgi:hypothetical protein
VRRLIAALTGLALVATGCSGSSGQVSSDCGVAVQRGGTTYSERGFTDAVATEVGKVGEVELAECHDTGPDPDGSVFTGHGAHVVAWTFAGQDPDQVLGIEAPESRWRILIADDVAAGDADRILAELTGDDSR